jgi:hypothetical protein
MGSRQDANRAPSATQSATARPSITSSHPLLTGEVFHGFTGSLSLRPVELLVPLADLTAFLPSQ